MAKVLLQCSSTSSQEPCGLCQNDTTAPAGCQLRLAESTLLVCDACARVHAPELLALVRLGDTAGRVGRIASFGIFPPMAALLDLAKAAEEYTAKTSPPVKNVA